MPTPTPHVSHEEDIQAIVEPATLSAEELFSDANRAPVHPRLPLHLSDIAISAGVNHGHDPINGNAEDPWQDLLAVRKRALALASCQMEEALLLKMFSRPPKVVVATSNTVRASTARRKHQAKFFCHLGGCESSFTRKSNLNSE